MNDQETRTIIKDNDRFTLVRELFDLALTGLYSLRELMEKSRSNGLRTRQHKRIGGSYLTISGVHRLLCNPFYAGMFVWAGETHKGAHEPMITIQEQEQVRRLLSKPGKPTPVRRTFPFTGLIRCGECGFMVTAEDKVNRYGKRYVYYHCTKRRLDYRCGQRSITAAQLDRSFRDFLSELVVPEPLPEWALRQVAKAGVLDQEIKSERRRSLQHSYDETVRALSNLTTLRIRDVIGDDEFNSQREALRREQFRLQEDLASSENQWFEPAEVLLLFSTRATKWYSEGNDATKKKVIHAIGSNLVLKDQMLSIEAKKPFIWFSRNADRSTLLAGLNEVGKLYTKRDPELLETLSLVRSITKEHEAANDPAFRLAA